MAAKRASHGAGQHLKQLAAIAAAAIVLVAGIYFFMQWQSNRPGTPVRELSVAVTSAGETRDIEPYTVCELDQQCDGGDPPSMPLDAGTVTVKVPEEVSSTSWRVLAIYDDPAANSENVFTSGEADSHDIDAVTDSGAKLVVAEVSALEVDKDDGGEETPVIATWSIGFE